MVNQDLSDCMLNLIPIEEEIDNWVNQDFWYHNQCIVHYDTDMPLQNGTDNEPRPITRSSPVDSFSSSQNLHQSSVDSNVFMTNGQTPPHHSSSSSLRVQIESPASSIYMAQNEPSVFVPSPTIPLQNRTSSSGGIATERFVTPSSSSSTSSEADSIYIQEGHMITFLKSDKGLEMFAKAYNITKADIIDFLDAKKNRNSRCCQHSSLADQEEKSDEDTQKRRRHRGTYSKSTCLKVIQFVKKGYSARAAAKKFGIPKSTVHNWLHEDVSTRPEKGHRKKDAHHEKFNENDHDYNKNVSDLGHSLSQTSIKDEPRHKNQNDQSVMDQSSHANSHTTPSSVSSQSALVQLLTTNRQFHSVKEEDHHNGAGFAACDVDHVDFDMINDLLQPDDWISHEQWYKQQYHDHYKDLSNAKLRKSYGTYSNEHRKKATEFVKSGRTLSAASKEFKIPKSTIHTWLNEGNVPCELPPELENCVVEEIEQSKDANSSPSLAVIKKKAEEVAVPHMEKFKPSFAWCRDFMKRHYMDREEASDPKKICLQDVNNKEDINSLISALGLNASRKDPLCKINMNSDAPSHSTSM